MTADVPAATLEQIRERLGFVVVTFNHGGWIDLASGDMLYDDIGDAVACRDDEQQRSARHGWEGRHVLAEVFELEEG